jgi:hypothetical protein
VAPPSEKDVLEVHGMFFLYNAEDDEIWLWEEKGQVWSVLPDIPSYLRIVNSRLAVIDIRTMQHRCNCLIFDVVNFGCKCGGV